MGNNKFIRSGLIECMYAFREGIMKLYAVSYLWMSLIGTVTTVVVGLLVSLITGM